MTLHPLFSGIGLQQWKWLGNPRRPSRSARGLGSAGALPVALGWLIATALSLAAAPPDLSGVIPKSDNPALPVYSGGHFCATCARASGDAFPAAPLSLMTGHPELNSAGADVVRWDPSTEPVEVDVIFLLSPSAIASAGNEETLRQSILKEVAHANFLFTNSLAGVRLNPVFIGKFNYTDSGNIARDLDLISTDARAAC